MNDHIMDGRQGKRGEHKIAQARAHLVARDHGIGATLAHSTPDPDAEPPPSPLPDDIPPPAHAPVQEPTLPEPPIKASPGAQR